MIKTNLPGGATLINWNQHSVYKPKTSQAIHFISVIINTQKYTQHLITDNFVEQEIEYTITSNLCTEKKRCTKGGEGWKGVHFTVYWYSMYIKSNWTEYSKHWSIEMQNVLTFLGLKTLAGALRSTKYYCLSCSFLEQFHCSNSNVQETSFGLDSSPCALPSLPWMALMANGKGCLHRMLQ